MKLELESLVTSRARAALLAWSVGTNEGRTMRELADELGFSVPRIQAEVEVLTSFGLLVVERRGGADEVRAREGALRRAVAALVGALSTEGDGQRAHSTRVRGELVALGAPLLDPPVATERPPEEVLLEGLKLARSDATVLRVLPLVLSRAAAGLDWNRLRALARRRRLKAELGMLLSLTAELTGRGELRSEGESLRDRRRRRLRSFHSGPLSHRARAMAEERTPASVRDWRFLMNMDLEAFRGPLERHG